MAAPMLKMLMVLLLLAMLLLLFLAATQRPPAGSASGSAYCPEGCQCPFDLTEPDQPQYLFCDGAGLGAVPTGEHYDNVTILFLGGNIISILSDDVFAPFPKLTIVDLNDNVLTVLDLRVFVGLGRLDELQLARNEIATILPVGYNEGELETLDLSFKQNCALEPRALAYNHLGVLQKLDLSFNRLRTLDPRVFEAAPLLQVLVLDGNPLTLPAESPLLVHSALRILSLDDVDGSTLSPLTFDELPNLKQLYLTASDVGDLTDAFATSPELSYLYLQKNEITELPAGVFAQGMQLDVLCLDDNPLQKIELEALEPLSFGGNFSFVDTTIACDCSYEHVWKWAQNYYVHLDAKCNSAPPCNFENPTTVY